MGADRKAYKAAWHAAHREEIAAKKAEWYAVNREKKLAYQTAYYATHREENAARCAAYYAAHREERKAAVRAYWAAHPGVGKAYRAAHPETYREHDRRHDAKRRGAPTCDHAGCLTLGASALAWQTNPHVCYLCGTPVWPGVNLHMDHVVPLARSGIHCADNIRPACGPCNQNKGTEVAPR